MTYPTTQSKQNKIAYWVLVLFALSTALTIIDTVLWHFDGPRYTHRMWFADRMDRINEDQKLKDSLNLRIDTLEQKINECITTHTSNSK